MNFSQGLPSKIQVSVLEANYRYSGKYSDRERFLEDQLSCTVCALHIRHWSVAKKNIHPTLEVLCCEKCISFYNYKMRKVALVMSICQWCAKNQNLLSCKSCSVNFCYDCLCRNYYPTVGHHNARDIIQKYEWKCFFCEPRPIWPQRAICAAAKHFVDTSRNDLKALQISVRINLLTSNNLATIVSSSDTSANGTAVLRRNSLPAEVSNAFTQMIKPELFVFGSLNVANKSIVEDSSLCVVCLETPATMVLYKCGHACLCLNCLHKIKASDGLCPICRDEFKDAIKLHM